MECTSDRPFYSIPGNIPCAYLVNSLWQKSRISSRSGRARLYRKIHTGFAKIYDDTGEVDIDCKNARIDIPEHFSEQMPSDDPRVKKMMGPVDYNRFRFFMHEKVSLQVEALPLNTPVYVLGNVKRGKPGKLCIKKADGPLFISTDSEEILKEKRSPVRQFFGIFLSLILIAVGLCAGIIFFMMFTQ